MAVAFVGQAVEIPSNDGREIKIVSTGPGEWFVAWFDSALYLGCARVDDDGNLLYGPVQLDRAGKTPDLYNSGMAWDGARIGWCYTNFLGQSYEAWFHLLDRDGNAVSAPVLVSDDVYPSYPLVRDLVFAEGQYLAGYAYQSNTNTPPTQIRTRLLDASGGIASPEITLWSAQPGEGSTGPSVARLGNTLAAAWHRWSGIETIMMAMADPQGNLLVPPAVYVSPASGGGPYVTGLIAEDDRFDLTFVERLSGGGSMPLEMIQVDGQGLVLEDRTVILENSQSSAAFASTRSGDGIGTAFMEAYGPGCPCIYVSRAPGDASFVAAGPSAGARVAFSSWNDRDAALELFVTRGPSPAVTSEVRVADDASAGFALLASYEPYPGATHGAALAGLPMGY
ncbi:MAG: hypothetical protein U0166_10235 [Acidobacteriota bacterium]